jgi:hypothetical protein
VAKDRENIPHVWRQRCGSGFSFSHVWRQRRWIKSSLDRAQAVQSFGGLILLQRRFNTLNQNGKKPMSLARSVSLKS